MPKKVFFHYADRKPVIKQATHIQSFIEILFSKENKLFERADYIFCSDEYLLSINQAYLKHDYYTDIITFDLSESEAIKSEIYISADRVKDNATLLNQPIQTELLRVIFHGALHLCGYRDKSENEKKMMRQKENEYIELFKKQFVPRGTN